MFARGFTKLFPKRMISGSRLGAGTKDDFQSHVDQDVQELRQVPEEYSKIRNLVFQQFSLLEGLESEFLKDYDKLMLFASKEDTEELVHFVTLDVKKAILDTALYNITALMNKSKRLTKDSNLHSEVEQTSKPQRRRQNIPIYARDILHGWFRNHVDHPYPTQEEKLILSKRTGLSLQKIEYWFINERNRKWNSYRRRKYVVCL